jgi:hypothetical protein
LSSWVVKVTSLAHLVCDRYYVAVPDLVVLCTAFARNFNDLNCFSKYISSIDTMEGLADRNLEVPEGSAKYKKMLELRNKNSAESFDLLKLT